MWSGKPWLSWHNLYMYPKAWIYGHWDRPHASPRSSAAKQPVISSLLVTTIRKFKNWKKNAGSSFWKIVEKKFENYFRAKFWIRWFFNFWIIPWEKTANLSWSSSELIIMAMSHRPLLQIILSPDWLALTFVYPLSSQNRESQRQKKERGIEKWESRD